MLQGDLITSKIQFHMAVTQADSILSNTYSYYDALDAKGLALSGLALIEDKENISFAKEAYLAARKVAKGAGIVKRNLRIFDKLAKMDSENILTDIRSCIVSEE